MLEAAWEQRESAESAVEEARRRYREAKDRLDAETAAASVRGSGENAT
jgi:hypothetical protein